MNQFKTVLSKNEAAEVFRLMAKYAPETAAAKKARLVEKAKAEAEGKPVEEKRAPFVVKFGLDNVTKLVEKKQAKLVPELIYTIEQYEATLIQVNKKTKGNVNLTMFIKRSTARDFRIDGEKLSRKMERREQNEEEKESKRRKDEEPQFCVC